MTETLDELCDKLCHGSDEPTVIDHDVTCRLIRWSNYGPPVIYEPHPDEFVGDGEFWQDKRDWGGLFLAASLVLSLAGLVYVVVRSLEVGQ